MAKEFIPVSDIPQDARTFLAPALASGHAGAGLRTWNLAGGQWGAIGSVVSRWMPTGRYPMVV